MDNYVIFYEENNSTIIIIKEEDCYKIKNIIEEVFSREEKKEINFSFVEIIKQINKLRSKRGKNILGPISYIQRDDVTQEELFALIHNTEIPYAK